jgi:hypothetical protein
LRRPGRAGIVGFKPARRTHQPTPDLFTATAATKAAPSKTLVIAPKDATESVGRPSAPRHLLPKDLPGALARLDDGEIDVLLTAVIGEARRRDRLSSNLMAKSLDSDQRPRKVSQSAVKYARAHPRPAHADDDAASLTQGQVNAVRAAFKAGIKPSMIVRQFGISQSNVRKVLASQAQERKS